MSVTFELLSWPDDGVRLDLDHRKFAYAGKFVLPGTGKAVGRAGDRTKGERMDTGVDGVDAPASAEAVLAAVAFDADRTDPNRCRLRYVTVRRDRRGERLGPRLAAFVLDRTVENGWFETARIAVNNPFAYVAAYRAGFGYTGTETGIAELELDYPPPADREPERYRRGLAAFGDRDLPADTASFVAARRGDEPPEPVDWPG